MASSTFTWIHLGSGPIIDPNEWNTNAENAGALVGQTYGSPGDPLFSHVTSVTTHNTGGTTGVLDQNNAAANDTFSTDIGSGPTSYTFDAGVIYNCTVTYTDGTTGTVSAVIVQDTAGHLYLAPEQTTNADTAVYQAKPIESITLGPVIQSDFTGFAASRDASGFDDGHVDGTSGNDLINAGYVEPIAGGTDRVDNGDAGLPGSSGDDDHIRAGAGNDSVHAGAGADMVYAGDGSDLVHGGSGNDTLFGESGADTILGEAGEDLVYGGLGNDSVDLGDGNDTFGSFSTDESGNDTVFGGAGNDSIVGGGGEDQVHGGSGNDTLSGSYGSDTLYGGADADTFFVTDDHDGDTIDGGATGWNFDTITFTNFTSNQGVGVTFTGSGAGTYDFAGTTGAGTFTNIEAISGTGYADTVNAAADTGGVQISSGAGADLVTGGSGADTILFGSGNDTVHGGAGDDHIDDLNGGQENGANLIYGGSGHDTVWSGSDSDTLYGGDGNDQLYGEAGADQFHGGAGNDLLSGGDDGDTFQVTSGEGAVTILGGEGGADADTLVFTGAAGVSVTYTGSESGSYSYGGGGSGSFSQVESVSYGDGADTISAAATSTGMSIAAGGGADSVTGGSGNDSLFGGEGADTLLGGGGADSLTGGAGDDSLAGQGGNDTLTGGSGRDVFGFADGSGADVVTDFDMTVQEGETTDQLDVSDLTNPDGSPVKAWDVVVGNDGNGNAVLTFPGGETVLLMGVSPGAVTPGALGAMGVPCFVRGTRIMTDQGPVAVEHLGPGALVRTRDHGLQPVLWHGTRALGAAELAAQPGLAPIRIAAGVLGNRGAISLSPQHGVLVAGRQGGQILRARHLAEFTRGIRAAEGVRRVEYHHLLLPRHALILVEGLWCESFYPGRTAMAALAPMDRLLLARLLARSVSPAPELATLYGPRCQPLLTRAAAQEFLHRQRPDLLRRVGQMQAA